MVAVYTALLLSYSLASSGAGLDPIPVLITNTAPVYPGRLPRKSI